MTTCVYKPDKKLPISVNSNEDLQNINPDYFFMCLVLDGYAILDINGIRCCITPGVLMCYDNSTDIKIIYTSELKAVSISFNPKFINVNLDWNVVRSDNYSLLCHEYNYPAFTLFFGRNKIYNGLIPLGTKQKERLSTLFKQSISEVRNQPDNYWSCRTRTYVLDIFDIGEYLREKLTAPPNEKERLVNSVIEYININIGDTLTLDRICREFNTNHTTLSYNFKRVTGLSVMEYTVGKRVKLASDTLAFTDLCVDEIAQEYGFYDVSHFNKAFKKYTGTTPQKYRTNALEKRMAGKIK